MVEDMTAFRKVYSRLRICVWKHYRKRINRKNTLRLVNGNVSILSMNCTGGILYHDLRLRFLSPTINLYMQAEDFIKFCESLPYYLSIDQMTECTNPAIKGNRVYPVAYLGDIKLFLVHYSSVKQAQQKWNERKQRIKKNSIVVIATDRDGMTDALKDRFERLPYSKVMFAHKQDKKHPSCFYLKGYEQDDSVGIVTDPIGWRGLRPIDQFDYISFFNKAVHMENRES